MKKILVLFMVSVLMLTGCTLMGGPKSEVEKFLNKYKNNDTVVVNELNEYLNTQELDEDELKDYREIYLRQYSNMDYKIKDEKIDGNKATVTVEVSVFDYYKANKDAGDYFTANQADFVDDDGDVDFGKYFTYKIKKLLDTTDKVTYTLDIKLDKNDNGDWEIESLTEEQLTKLHGTYEY